jgi:hypothetical protein
VASGSGTLLKATGLIIKPPPLYRSELVAT